MYTLEQIREKLKFYNLRALSNEIDIPYMTLWRAIRKVNAPTKYQVVKKLSDFLTKQG
jgi:hypothetical protein